MLELGLVLTLAMVLRVGQGIRHKVNAKCRVWSATRKNRSGRARARCRARIGCTAKGEGQRESHSSERTEDNTPWHSLQFVSSPPGTCSRF